MAGGVLDYNGYRIASGALNDNILNLLEQKGLLQNPMMSGPVPLQDQNSLNQPFQPSTSTPASVLRDAFGGMLPDISAGSSPANMGYEMRPSLNRQPIQPIERQPIERSIEPALSYGQTQPVGGGVLAAEVATPASPTQQAQGAPMSGSPALGDPAQKQYDPYADIMAGRQRAAGASAAGAQNEANLRGDLVDQGGQAIPRLQALQKQAQEEMKQYEDAQNSLVLEYKNGDIKDPWASKSGGEKILAAVGLALGGAGSALTKTPNYALSIINDQINRDIDIQKTNLDKKKGEIDINNSLLASARTKFGDLKLAELEVQGLERMMLNDKLDQITAQTSSDVKKAQIQELKGLNTLEMNKFKDEAIKRKQDLLRGAIDLKRPQNDSPAQKAVDSAFGKTYAEYFASGKVEDVKSNLNKLEEVIYNLENFNVTGPGVGSTPDAVNRMFNEKALDTRAAIESIIQRDLRETLGAQFTEKEGENLIKRGYDQSLSEEINLKRVRRLQSAMKNALKAKEDAARYYEQNGTLSGYQGVDLNRIRSADQFLNTFSGPGEGKEEGKASNQINQLKQQFQQRLQSNPNDQEAADGLQKIQSRGF